MPGNPLDDLSARIDAHEQCCREMVCAFDALIEFLPTVTLPSSKDMARRDDAVRRMRDALARAGGIWE